MEKIEHDYYKIVKKIAYQPHSTTTLALIKAATQIIDKRFSNCPPSLLFPDPRRFPSREVALQRTADERLCDLIPPVDDSWVRYASKINQSSTFEENRVSSSLRDLVRNEYLDVSIVEDYLELLRTLSSQTKIAPIHQLRQDGNISIETEGIDHSIIIPFIDGQDWAFAVVYFDCIHWYDSGPLKQIPDLSASGGQRIVEGWRGPQHNDSKDSGVFMLMGISHIIKQQPHVSQEAANDLVQSFRVRILIELLAEQLDPTPECLSEKGIIKGAREDGACIIVSQTDRDSPSSQFEEDSFNDTMYVLQSTAQDSHSVPPEPPASTSMDQTAYTSVAHGDNLSQWGRQQISSVNRANEVQSAAGGLRNDSGGTYRYILPAVHHPLVATSASNHYPTTPFGMNTSRRMTAPRRRIATARITMGPEPNIKSMINRKVILENLSSALRFTRSALASDLDNGYMLWLLGKNRKTGGKLQQRYQRVLFNQKMAERVDQDLKIDGLNDRQWKSMKKDFGYWKVWVDMRDVGLKYDDLGEFVTLCALPGSMNSENMSGDYQKSLVAAFEREIEDSSSPLRQWLRDARQLCDMILTKSIPAHPLKLDDYETNVEEEVSDVAWKSHMSTDSVGDFQDEISLPYDENTWALE
ncbi:hypothetical protein FBEOM_3797 [Fusarium beomiforme]|uniref:Uncharacterized protein n=1 Tax=Fusarium beomiforme TaxID=44412 RepID=A0A9P5AP22_9HYPO|nr:hypothetical protein FBEOM_3797 [Fusarium beomiforme]